MNGAPPLILGLGNIAKRIGISRDTLKVWKSDPTKPVGKYLTRVGNRLAISERLLAQMLDELTKGEQDSSAAPPERKWRR